MMSGSKKWIVGVFLVLGVGKSVVAQETGFRGKEGLARGFAKAVFDSCGSFDVLHYRLDLTFPLTTDAFSGSVTLTFRACQDGLDGVTFQMVDLHADSVLVESGRAAFVQTGEEIRVGLGETLAEDDTFSVSVFYQQGAPAGRGFYFYPLCAYTMSEPEDARRWFPCHDVPWDKATAEVHVTVPRGVEVASIGLLEGRELSGDGAWETFHWRTQYPVATYLVCVTMSSSYARWSDWYVSPEEDSLEMAYYIFVRDSANAKQDFVHMVDAMTFFSDRFGPYPFEKYGMAEVEPFVAGGMEHQTMTTINSRWIRGDGWYESGLVHELAHMWWGDAVTLNDWAAIWLNEGFAVYSEALFVEDQYGWDAFQAKMDASKVIYFSKPTKQDFPIYDPPAGRLFDWEVVYNKGGWVLHMLRGVVGEEAFWWILRTYYETYGYANASIPDFRSVCETVSGMGLDWFFREWIYDQGYPRVRYSWSVTPVSAGGCEVVLTLEQVQTTGPVFRMPVDVRFEGGESATDTTVWMEDVFGVFTFILDDTPEDILLDPDGWVLMTSETGTGGGRRPGETPDGFYLYSSFPNPFNETTVVYYNVPEGFKSSQDVRIEVYNVTGRLVRTLVDETETPGRYWVVWDGRDDDGRRLSSGIYVIGLWAGDFSQARKVVLVR